MILEVSESITALFPSTCYFPALHKPEQQILSTFLRTEE